MTGNSAPRQFPFADWITEPRDPDAEPVPLNNPPPAQGLLFPGEVL